MIYSFDVSIATEIGVDEAIMFQNLVFWISKNQANQKHYHDGRYWTYNSQQAFCELFPFWSRRQIQRILNSLEEKNIIIRANHNKSTYDRTSWYALTDLGHSITRNGSLHCTKWCNGKYETVQPIPDINTDNKTHLIKTDNKYNVEQSPTEAIFEIINHLNKVTGSNYRTSSTKTQTLIKARMNEGFSVEDFKTVINNKHQEWNTTEMSVYLRPETLFGTKFESYLNQNKGKKNEVTFRIDEQGNKRDEFGLLIL
jgi:uncharacterized phage protein (TIGR02220 family)